MPPRKPKNGQPNREREIKLPCSAPGAVSTYAKLLYRVDPPEEHSFPAMGWHGTMFKPGRAVSESELRPGTDYPDRPIVLEFAGRDPGGKYRYILWELAPSGKWEKLATAEAVRDEWARTLYPIAKRVLEEQGVGHVAASRDLNQLTKKFTRFIEKQLKALEPRQKVLYLAQISKIIARISARLLQTPAVPPESL